MGAPFESSKESYRIPRGGVLWESYGGSLGDLSDSYGSFYGSPMGHGSLLGVLKVSHRMHMGSQ